MKQPRRRRKIPRSIHLSISATDEEWENVRNNATRRRLSIARYLVGLALGEVSTAADSTGPEVALDPSEQREGLDILRRIDQYAGDEESSPLIVDLQARVAVIFDGWAKGMVAEGRSQELRDTLVHVVGEEYAGAGLTVLNQSPIHTYTRRTIQLQSSEEIFTTEEKEYLEKYGDLFTQLMNGEREPSTDAQKRFVEVSHGRCDPETEYEQLWWKYIQRIKV